MDGVRRLQQQSLQSDTCRKFLSQAGGDCSTVRVGQVPRCDPANPYRSGIENLQVRVTTWFQPSYFNRSCKKKIFWTFIFTISHCSSWHRDFLCSPLQLQCAVFNFHSCFPLFSGVWTAHVTIWGGLSGGLLAVRSPDTSDQSMKTVSWETNRYIEQIVHSVTCCLLVYVALLSGLLLISETIKTL